MSSQRPWHLGGLPVPGVPVIKMFGSFLLEAVPISAMQTFRLLEAFRFLRINVSAVLNDFL